MPKLEIPQPIDDNFAARTDPNTFEDTLDTVARNRNILMGGLFAGCLGGLAYTVNEGDEVFKQANTLLAQTSPSIVSE